MLPTPGGYTTLLAFPRDVPSAPLGKRLVTVSITTCMEKLGEATAMRSANVDRSQLNSGGSFFGSRNKELCANQTPACWKHETL